MVTIMKFLILSAAAAVFVALAPHSARAADSDPPVQNAAADGAYTQPAVPKDPPAISTDTCHAPEKFCLDDAERERLNRAIFLPRPDSDKSILLPPVDPPQPYQVRDPDRSSSNASEDRPQPCPAMNPADRPGGPPRRGDTSPAADCAVGNTADKIDEFIDNHLGGLGKMEFDRPGYKMRFEYIYGRRCRMKGPGICLSVQF